MMATTKMKHPHHPKSHGGESDSDSDGDDDDDDRSLSSESSSSSSSSSTAESTTAGGGGRGKPTPANDNDNDNDNTSSSSNDGAVVTSSTTTATPKKKMTGENQQQDQQQQKSPQGQVQTPCFVCGTTDRSHFAPKQLRNAKKKKRPPRCRRCISIAEGLSQQEEEEEDKEKSTPTKQQQEEDGGGGGGGGLFPGTSSSSSSPPPPPPQRTTKTTPAATTATTATTANHPSAIIMDVTNTTITTKTTTASSSASAQLQPDQKHHHHQKHQKPQQQQKPQIIDKIPRKKKELNSQQPKDAEQPTKHQGGKEEQQEHEQQQQQQQNRKRQRHDDKDNEEDQKKKMEKESNVNENNSSKTKKKRKSIFDLSDEEEEEDNGHNSPNNDSDVSLEELKFSILGRKMDTTTPSRYDDRDSSYKNSNRGSRNDRHGHGHGREQQAHQALSSSLSSTTATTTKEALRHDLECSVCREIFLDPVTLPCGHTFCFECLSWWGSASMSQRQRHHGQRYGNGSGNSTNPSYKCPTCRAVTSYWVQGHVSGGGGNSSFGNIYQRQISRIPENRQLGINMALRGCIMTLFQNELQERLDLRLKAIKGEHGGRHNEAFQELTSIEESKTFWVRSVDVNGGGDATKRNNYDYPPKNIQIQRSVVMDSDDQRMQLALAIYGRQVEFIRSSPPSDQDAMVASPIMIRQKNADTTTVLMLKIQLCLLHLEEDEAEADGIPVSVEEGGDDEQFIATDSNNSGSEFTNSFVMVSAISPNNTSQVIEPLARRQMGSDGIVDFTIPLNDSSTILLHHEETGLELVCRIPTKNQDTRSSSLLNGKDRASEHLFDDNKHTSSRNPYVYQDEEDDDDDEENEYDDEDGFIVDEAEDDGDEDEENEEELEFEYDTDGNVAQENNEDDLCCICRVHGELLICDGGDHTPGCSRGFHSSCVGLETIPDGDWICQECASQIGIETDSGGHEFPAEEGSDGGSDPRSSPVAENHGNDDDSELEGHFSSEAEDHGKPLEDTDDSDNEGEMGTKKKKVDADSNKPNAESTTTKRRYILDDDTDDEDE